jgi:hypothetical protein
MDTLRYERVKDDADNESSQVDEHIETGERITLSRRHRGWDWPSISVGIFLGFVLTFPVFRFLSMELNDTCTRKMSTWSPALEIYNDDLILRRFNGALREPNQFRGPPSPSIDTAWERITYAGGGLVRLLKEQLDKVNASEYAAAYTEDMGGGYIAGIEVFHQLHCVNMLRKVTYMDYYLPRNKEWEDQETLRYHLGKENETCIRTTLTGL